MLKDGYAAVSSRSVATAAMQGLAFSAVQDSVAGYDTAADDALAALGRLVDRLETGRTKRR